MILERGACVEERKKDVDRFWETGVLDPSSNVQFGEGGAGTFSDGKLNTLVKDVYKRQVEYISDSKLLGAKTLFATHYHELTELEGKIDNVNNHCIAVKEKGDDIVFLRKIVKGGADKSYGIQVAKLAGVPDLVISRAKEIVEELSDEMCIRDSLYCS